VIFDEADTQVPGMYYGDGLRMPLTVALLADDVRSDRR
jgi:hypothetical protein